MRKNLFLKLAVLTSLITLLAACGLGSDLETLRQLAAEKNGVVSTLIKSTWSADASSQTPNCNSALRFLAHCREPTTVGMS